MRLKSSIFLWVSLATVIPLSALVLGITAYSERLYRHNVDETIQGGIKNIVSELEFRFNYEREVMLSLASLPVMKQFRETLSQVANGTTPRTYTNELAALNNLLTGFQHSVPGVDAVSVLDQSGNPLVKVYLGKQEVASQVTSSSAKIDTSILSRMRELKPQPLLYGELFVSQDSENIKPLLNPIVTLENGKGEAVGFLAAESIGDQLDHLLQVLPRSHQFKIEIVELNVENESRHGLILYSDTQNILFNQLNVNTPKLWQQLDQHIWQEVEQNRSGSFYLKDQSHIYFYQELYPYNNPQISWVVMLRIDERELTAPFNRIRIGLLVFAALILLISLALAELGARYIANPIAKFSAALTQIADGKTNMEFRLKKPERAAEELQELEVSFKYLVKTLKASEEERDRAQSMMLQQAKLASIGEMAAGIGHEINNPLNNILSYIKLIERDLPGNSEQLQQDINGLREETLRAGRIVKGVLNFARQVPPEYSHFDMQQWLQETMVLIEPEARKRHVTVVLHELTEIELSGDRNQLQQVMVNLLMNAIQASDAQEKVEILVQQMGEHFVRIIIADQGTGIDKMNKSKIFDPFFTTKLVGEGSGLGLSISLGIIQFHNGNLELVNNLKGGVDAIVTLPLGTMTDEPI